MPTYDFACPGCGARHEAERTMDEASAPSVCPVCGAEAVRVYTAPRFLFKADPRDVRPVWHNHTGYSHAHAPRRGRHRTSSEDH
ncbi:MAG: zinc ribbon domain-containing protein [Thermomicrobiales bacterium]